MLHIMLLYVKCYHNFTTNVIHLIVPFRRSAHLIKALTQQCIRVRQSPSTLILMPTLQLLPLTCDIMTLYCNLINCEPSWLYLVLLLQQLGCYTDCAPTKPLGHKNQQEASNQFVWADSRICDIIKSLNCVVCLYKVAHVAAELEQYCFIHCVVLLCYYVPIFGFFLLIVSVATVVLAAMLKPWTRLFAIAIRGRRLQWPK